MKHPVRKLVAAAAALLVLIPGAAWADNVVNDVITSDESVSLQVGQQATVTLTLNATGGAPPEPSGCNLNTTGGEKLVLSVNNSNGSVASGPSSVEFTQCATGAPGPNTGSGGTRTVTVTANAVGQTTFTFTRTSTNGAGEVFSTSQAAFTVIVTAPPPPDQDGDGIPDADDECPTDPTNTCNEPPADTQDPEVTVTAPSGANGAGWYNTSPISVAVSATDNVGVTSFECSVDGGTPVAKDPAGDTVSVGEGTHTVSCTATDAAGNDGSDSETVKVDATDPEVTVAAPAGANAAGWYKTDPISVAVSASDNVGVTSFTCSVDNGTAVAKNASGDSVSVTGDGSHTVACTATDAAGNEGGDNDTVKIDTELPTIDHTLTPSAPNGLGWFNQSVGVDFTCDDKVSLIATCEGDTTLGEGENQTATGKATDNAGNEATDTVTDIDVDLTKPELNISGLDSGTYDICATPTISRPTFAPTDNLSGIQSQSDSWTTPTTATGVGSYAYTATAKDNADNETNGGRTYTLNYGAAAFSGPLQPINADGTSRFKLGSTVPVKFRLACNGVAISGAVATLTVKKYDGSADPGTDEAISTSNATTGNLFRWSSTDQQYIFNLSTKAGYTNPGSSTPISFTNGTWTFTINLDDGTKRSFNLNLVR